MKIGLAITTTEKRQIHESVMTNNDADKFFYFVDKSMQGVSKSRNDCIKSLYNQDCDYIAIMDDDVQILRHGAMRYCANVMLENDIHMVGTPNSFGSELISAKGQLCYWNNVIGAFHMFSRKFIDKVGYFNTEYDRYGFEDCEMQWRAKRSGLCGSLPGIPSPLRLPYYLLSEDVYGMNPEPTIGHEEKQIYIEKNRPIFNQAILSEKVFYPYHK